jgi:hypothetical protein
VPCSPLVVAEGHDIKFFSSEAALARYLEPWFVADVEYRAFDSEGLLLELVVVREPIARRWLPDTSRERIAVRARESEPSHGQELAELLVRWLPMVGAATPTPDAALAELLRLAIERTGLDP